MRSRNKKGQRVVEMEEMQRKSNSHVIEVSEENISNTIEIILKTVSRKISMHTIRSNSYTERIHMVPGKLICNNQFLDSS